MMKILRIKFLIDTKKKKTNLLRFEEETRRIYFYSRFD